MLGTQILSMKVLVLPTFTYGAKIWGGDWRNHHWKVFEKGVKIHIMSHLKVCTLTTYHLFLAKFGDFPMELDALKLAIGFQQCFAHSPSSWSVSQTMSLA